MARIFKKYEFADQQEANNYLDQLPTIVDEYENNYPDHQHHIKVLGYLVQTPGTYDEEGNELTPTIFSDKYSIDILWHEETSEPYKTNWANKEITNDGTWSNANGAHTWFGLGFS